MFPHSHQELARQRHADLIRAATQERLAASLREERRPAHPSPAADRSLRWFRVVRRRPAVHTA